MEHIHIETDAETRQKGWGVSSTPPSCFSQLEHDRLHTVTCLAIKSVSNCFSVKQMSFSVDVFRSGLQIMPATSSKNKQTKKTNLVSPFRKIFLLGKKSSSWPEHHCSVYSAKDALGAKWTYEMRLITASFRSAFLKSTAEGEENRTTHLLHAPTHVLCSAPRSQELISSL